jgi:hypothetical protein
MKTLAAMVSFAYVLALGSASGQGAEDLLRQRFLAEYPDAYGAWEKLVSSVEGEIKLATVDSGESEAVAGRESPGNSVVYSFKYKLPDAGAVVTSEYKQGLLEQRVFGSNPKYSFFLAKTGEEAQYSIRSFEFRTSGGPEARLPSSSLLYFPYGTRVLSLKAVGRPYFSVRSTSSVPRDGKNLLKVSFEVIPSPDKLKSLPKSARPLTGEGEIVVSPEEKWVLYEYSFRKKTGFGGSPLYKGTVEYEGSFGGFPAPKRAVRQEIGADGKLAKVETYEFLTFRAVALTNSEFTLSAFGLPEAASQSPTVGRSKGGIGYWFMALAAAALIAAVIFKSISSRVDPAARV